MQRLAISIAFVLSAVLAGPVAAQTATTAVGTAPGMGTAAQTVKFTATITAIDAATRDITLKGPQGNEVTVTAGPEVKNFANMKVGDLVNVDYLESLTLELKKGGGLIVQRTAKDGAASAVPGAKPAAAAGRQVTIVADVIDVNAATQTITLQGSEAHRRSQNSGRGAIQADREGRPGRSDVHAGGRGRGRAGEEVTRERTQRPCADQ